MNLLAAFSFFVISAGFSQNKRTFSNHSSSKITERIGTASYYSNKFIGRKTASGEIFSQKKMTAACNIFPLGTKVRVINLKNRKSVIVKINDRLHFKNKRLIDLTTAAAEKLNFKKLGLAKVRIEKIRK